MRASPCSWQSEGVTLRVLVIEDDLDLLEATSDLLTEDGFDVDTARDGEQAWKRLEAGAHYDVIVLDLMMPVLDGFAFRERQLKSRHQVVPVVIVSAGRPPPETIETLRSCAFVHKPFDGEALVREVRRCATRPAA